MFLKTKATAVPQQSLSFFYSLSSLFLSFPRGSGNPKLHASKFVFSLKLYIFSLEICIFKLEIYISRLKIQIFRSNLRFAVRPTAKRFLLPLQSYQHALVVAGPRALRFDDGILRSFISPLSANDGSFRTKNGGFHRPDTGALVENKVDAVPFIRFGCPASPQTVPPASQNSEEWSGSPPPAAFSLRLPTTRSAT